jgi:biopolymer transport protein ExbD
MGRMNHSFKTIIVDVLTIVLACFMVVFSQMKVTREEFDLPPVTLPESPDSSKKDGQTSISKPVISIKGDVENKIYYLNEQVIGKTDLFKVLKDLGAKGVVLRGDKNTSFSWGELAQLNAQLYASGIREIIYRLQEEKER